MADWVFYTKAKSSSQLIIVVHVHLVWPAMHRHTEQYVSSHARYNLNSDTRRRISTVLCIQWAAWVVCATVSPHMFNRCSCFGCLSCWPPPIITVLYHTETWSLWTAYTACVWNQSLSAVCGCHIKEQVLFEVQCFKTHGITYDRYRENLWFSSLM